MYNAEKSPSRNLHTYSFRDKGRLLYIYCLFEVMIEFDPNLRQKVRNAGTLCPS